LTPLCVKAQFHHGFERGYYVLAAEPTVRRTGNMRIEPFYSTLIVKDTSRPDLASLVQEKKVGFYELEDLLRAFNTGQPYQKKR